MPKEGHEILNQGPVNSRGSLCPQCQEWLVEHRNCQGNLHEADQGLAIRINMFRDHERIDLKEEESGGNA